MEVALKPASWGDLNRRARSALVGAQVWNTVAAERTWSNHHDIRTKKNLKHLGCVFLLWQKRICIIYLYILYYGLLCLYIKYTQAIPICSPKRLLAFWSFLNLGDMLFAGPHRSYFGNALTLSCEPGQDHGAQGLALWLAPILTIWISHEMLRSFKSADLIDLIKLSIDHPVLVFSKTAEILTGFLSSRGERVSSARYDEYQNTVKFQSNQTGRFSAIQCCLCTSQGLDDFLMRSTSIQP